MHSAIPSTSTNIKNNDSIFYCARCPYETRIEAVYLKHFFSTHLKKYGTENASTVWECDICKKTFVRGMTKINNHFKTHHDTSSLDDPDRDIQKCSENGCPAYFLSKRQLYFHKVNQHSSSSNSANQLNELANDMIEIIAETGCYKCSFCMKESNKFRQIQKHVRTFHYQTLIDPAEDLARNKNGNRLFCPAAKCTKTFETSKGLEIHKKFHGTFSCLFCDEVKNYATVLARHEHEVHTSQSNTEDQQFKPQKFKCSRCPKIYLQQSNYTRHFINEHLGISTIHSNCSICQFECHNESLRRHHLSNHYTAGMNPEKVLKCIKCTAYFRTDKQLARHIERIHIDPTKPRLLIRKCTNCDIMFKNLLHLERHLDKEHPNSNISSEFKCDKCNRYFAGEVSLKSHVLQIHSKKRLDKLKSNVRLPDFCLLDCCKRRFKDTKSLKLHQNLHIRGEYFCKFCDVVVNSIIKLSLHESSKHPNKVRKNMKEGFYYCSRCHYQNTSVIRYQNHFARKHLGLILKSSSALKLLGKYKCNFCQMETVSAAELGYHEATHINNDISSKTKAAPKIQCPRCPKSYMKVYYIKHFLKIHFNRCTKNKQTVCPICKEKATVPKNHLKKYHDTEGLEDSSKIYKCEGEDNMCQAYFIKYDQLIQHKKLRHPVLEWSCKDCEKIYKTEKSFYMHRRDFHLNVQKNPGLEFVCYTKNCQRGFETKEDLEQHKNRGRCQTKSKEFGNAKIKCDACNKEFPSKVKLRDHVYLVHTTSYFMCQECGKAFKTKDHLKNHSEYHKGPEAWKFQCSTCGKKCVSKYTLTAHLRTHTGEKPHVCQYCGEKYAHLHNWKKHVLTKHKNEEDLPKIRKTPSTKRVSRKGTKKGDCLIAEATQ